MAVAASKRIVTSHNAIFPATSIYILLLGIGSNSIPVIGELESKTRRLIGLWPN
jgi:hypothetical protein